MREQETMKRALIFVLALILILPVISSCQKEENVTENLAVEMPEPFDFPEPSGPEALGMFRSRFNNTFLNLTSDILDLAEERDELERWFDEKFKESLFDPYADEITVLSFAERFDISKEKLLEAISETDYTEGWIVSPSDVEIIYSGDKELINKTFVNEYALLHGENVYSAEWVYMHGPDDYLNEGIPFDKAINCLAKMEELPFTEEALKALDNKTAYLKKADNPVKETEDTKLFTVPEKECASFFSGYDFDSEGKESGISSYSLVYKEKVYSPQWLYENSVSDYIGKGLPLEETAERLEKMGDFPFTDEARAELEKKAELVRKIYSFSFDYPVSTEEYETVSVTEAPKTDESVSTTPAP